MTLHARLFAIAVAITLVAPSIEMVSGPAFARSAPEPGRLKVKLLPRKRKVVLIWKGRIMAPMARQFADAIDEWSGRASRGFIIDLDSGGGKVREAGRVVHLLKRLRASHKVETYVRHGRKCGSSCVPIFLQGERRTAAYASMWLFHQITRNVTMPDGRRRRHILPGATDKFFERFFIPAGVPRGWIASLKPKIEGADYWMTGAELAASGSRIATRFLLNRRVRRLPYFRGDGPQASGQSLR